VGASQLLLEMDPSFIGKKRLYLVDQLDSSQLRHFIVCDHQLLATIDAGLVVGVYLVETLDPVVESDERHVVFSEECLLPVENAWIVVTQKYTITRVCFFYSIVYHEI